MEKLFFLTWSGGSVLLGMIFGQGAAPEVNLQTPATIMAAFIAVSVGAFGTIGWVLREKFKENKELRDKIDKLVEAIKDLKTASEAGLNAVHTNCAMARLIAQVKHEAETAK